MQITVPFQMTHAPMTARAYDDLTLREKSLDNLIYDFYFGRTIFILRS